MHIVATKATAGGCGPRILVSTMTGRGFTLCEVAFVKSIVYIFSLASRWVLYL